MLLIYLCYLLVFLSARSCSGKWLIFVNICIIISLKLHETIVITEHAELEAGARPYIRVWQTAHFCSVCCSGRWLISCTCVIEWVMLHWQARTGKRTAACTPVGWTIYIDVIYLQLTDAALSSFTPKLNTRLFSVLLSSTRCLCVCVCLWGVQPLTHSAKRRGRDSAEI